MSMKGFTTKLAEKQMNVFIRLFEASAGREAVRGFTLVETMVAITIVTLAITAALFSANSSLVAANIARDQLTASYLAQEGIEKVRLQRDNQYLVAYGGANASAVAWANFLSSLPITDTAPNMGATTFTRTIQATPADPTQPNTDEKITSRVSWIYHGITYAVTVTDHLTPWQ